MNRCIRTITSEKKNEKEEECTSECEDVPLVELRTLYLHVCQVRDTVGDSGLCWACVTSFER